MQKRFLRKISHTSNLIISNAGQFAQECVSAHYKQPLKVTSQKSFWKVVEGVYVEANLGIGLEHAQQKKN